MSLAIVFSRALQGIDAPLVTVEVHLANGLPGLSIVGLPEAAVRESKDRVRAALLHSHFQFPARRITINLAPADLPKEGGRYDLAIALGILAASGQIPDQRLQTSEFVGELALDGSLRPVRGVITVAMAARQAGRRLVIPADNQAECALISNDDSRYAGHLLDVCRDLHGEATLPTCRLPEASSTSTAPPPDNDLGNILGQQQARRALEVAAAGGHNLLMIGPPGSGKTMLAGCLPGILPDMSEQESLELAAIRSLAATPGLAANWRQRPFRAPHHSCSAIALTGGGSVPQPGEISLAHAGILFLDELPEFDRRALEMLREPLESGTITISRVRQKIEFPARFQLLAAMNPCPCGHLGDPAGHCHCSPAQVQRYRQRISGPLLDRIDMHCQLQPLAADVLIERPPTPAEDSARVRQRVDRARQRQRQRQGTINARLAADRLDRYLPWPDEGKPFLCQAIERLGLSARAVDRLRRVARTLADLDDCQCMMTEHLAEAIQYRHLDRRQQRL